MKKYYSRRDFIGKTSAGLAGAAAISGFDPSVAETGEQAPTTGDRLSYKESPFVSEVERLPVEEIYDYHKYLSTAPVHVLRRCKNAKRNKNEMSLPDKGWKICYLAGSGIILENAVEDFRDYMNRSQGIMIEKEAKGYLKDWKKCKNSIVVGTKKQLQDCGDELKSPKDYEIRVTPKQILVCGFDERGAMFGLYNLESRMNLREGPILPKDLKIVRYSLYDTRMVLSWMGWMEWPDNLLSHLVHDGFDAIFASVYANPNGDRTTAETSTDFYARRLYGRKRQDPEKVRNLIKRAARFGVKFYAPIVWQYMGTKESEEGLRNLIRDIVKEFPDIRGYVLLTEGFWYKKWGGGHGADKKYIQEWARNWCTAVEVVKEECHKIDPSIEILPWEYNINFRPDNSDVKRYFIKQLPEGVTPLLTWENGKSFEIDGMKGFLRDYSLNQIGPAEVTSAQINEANKRNMKVFSKVDTSSSWQYGTLPYLPCPYQWYDRYTALEKFGVSGSLESWSSGYKPNFLNTIRAWTCWSNGPSRDELFEKMASSMFGSENRELVLKAWDHFSKAIRYVPDTGPNMGTNGAIGNPLFFRKPPLRGVTFDHSWWDANLQACQTVNPYWPFTISRMVFFPDFSNKTNKAENYARSATGIQVSRNVKLLPVFLKYLKLAIDEMEEGLKFYREAALKSNEQKRKNAVHEVIVAEQMQRMMQSDHAILEFEDHRLQLAREKNANKFDHILDKMENILRKEIVRTELSLLAASRDSRLGFQHEQDYVYTPFSLEEKIRVMRETLEKHIPQARLSKSI